MTREFFLSEKVDSFDEILHECLADIFGIDDYQALKEDHVFLLFLKQAHLAYLKSLRKANKNSKKKGPLPLPSQMKADNHPVAPEFKSVDDFSDQQSQFCDLGPVFEEMAHAEEFPSLTDFYLAMDDEGGLEQFIDDIASYAHLLTLGLNRTIIDVTPHEIGEEILLNTSDIFTRMPQYSLFLDVSKIDDPLLYEKGEPGEEDSKVTGISVQRLSIVRPKKVKPPKDDPNQQYIFDGINIMVCLDNVEYYSLGTLVPLDKDTTVDEMLNLSLMSLDPDENEPLVINNGEETFEVNCSEQFYQFTKRIVSYIVYAITHQDEIKNAQGQKVCLENNDMTRLVGNQPLDVLGQKELPFIHYSL